MTYKNYETIKLEIDKKEIDITFNTGEYVKELEYIELLKEKIISEKLRLIKKIEEEIKNELNRKFNTNINLLEFYEFKFRKNRACNDCYCKVCLIEMENTAYVLPFETFCSNLRSDIVKWFYYYTNYEKILMIEEFLGFETEIPENRLNELTKIKDYILENYDTVGHRVVLM